MSDSECSCDQGWTGSDCSVEIDHCASDRCLNGASCIDGEEGATCLCDDKWAGETCGMYQSLWPIQIILIDRLND